MKKLIAALVLMVLLGAAIVLVVVNKAEAPEVSSYQECADRGYPIQESYPSVCRTPDGQSFTNPDQAPSMARDDTRKKHATKLAANLLAVSLDQKLPPGSSPEIFQLIMSLSAASGLLSDPLTAKPYVYSSDQAAMVVGEATYRVGATCDNKISGSQGEGLLVEGSAGSMAVAIKLESGGYACESNL